MAQQFPAAQEQTEAIQHVLPRRAAAASTRPPVAAPSLLVAEGGPLRPPPLPHGIRSSLQKRCRRARRRQGERELLRERVSASLPPPEEGRVDNLLFNKNLDRKQFSLFLGPKRAWRVMDGSTPDPTHPRCALLTHPLPNYGTR